LVDQFVVNFLISIISNKRKKEKGTLSLCNGMRIFKIGLRYSFIQGTSARR